MRMAVAVLRAFGWLREPVTEEWRKHHEMRLAAIEVQAHALEEWARVVRREDARNG